MKADYDKEFYCTCKSKPEEGFLAIRDGQSAVLAKKKKQKNKKKKKLWSDLVSKSVNTRQLTQAWSVKVYAS